MEAPGCLSVMHCRHISPLPRERKMKNKIFAKILSAVTAFICTISMVNMPVKAEGYWTDGYWDGVNNVWVDGYWIETSGGQTWSDGGYTQNYNWGNTPARGFTYYNQYSNPYVVIGSGNMRSNGCVPTAGAMLLSGYGYYTIPTDLGWYLYGTGNFDNYYGHGGSDLCWYDIAGLAGIGAWGIYDYDSMVAALQSGATVACHIYYGGGTHAVIATGYNNGNTTVYDPIGGIYTKSVASLWNGRSFVWNDVLSGTSIIALG
jgi:hypothetical protein